MAVKIQRSHIILILNLLLGILGGTAIQPLLSDAPVCPPAPETVITPEPARPVVPPVAIAPDGVGGNSGVEPAGGAAPLAN